MCAGHRCHRHPLFDLGAAADAVRSAYRILKAGGQIVILDLARHNFERAHELYGDRWPGFAESDLQRWLEAAGFKFVAAGDFWRVPGDTHDFSSLRPPSPVDGFVLKYQKP